MRWLVAGSLVFYGWWDPRFVPLLIGSVLANYRIAHEIRGLMRAGSPTKAKFALIA